MINDGRYRAVSNAVMTAEHIPSTPFVWHHINMMGRYSFQLPEMPGGLRPLRDKDATDEE